MTRMIQQAGRRRYRRRTKPMQPVIEFMEQHGLATVTGLYWCDGPLQVGRRPVLRWQLTYCWIVLGAVGEFPGRKVTMQEFRGETAARLVEAMIEAGLNPGPVDEVQRICESAGRSPRIRKGSP